MMLSMTSRAILVLGLTSLLTGTCVDARAAHERYNPYGYLSPTPTGSAGAGANTLDTTDSSLANTTDASLPAATTTTTSGINIVAVKPPPSKGDVPYIANTFFANWHATSPNDTDFNSPTGSSSGTTGGAPSEGGRTFTLQDLQWDLVYSVTYGSLYALLPTFFQNSPQLTLILNQGPCRCRTFRRLNWLSKMRPSYLSSSAWPTKM